MTNRQIYSLTQTALKKARKEPFPVHVVSQAAQVSIEAGKLLLIANEVKYSNYSDLGKMEKNRQIEGAAIEVIVKVLRFLENIKEL